MEDKPKILIRFVVAVVQKNNSNSVQQRSMNIAINRDQQISKFANPNTHERNFFKLPDIPNNYNYKI